VRILITGAAGLLGTALLEDARSRNHEAIGLGKAELDVTDGSQVSGAVTRHAPDAIVHCAAYTAVDRAETERALAMAVNRDGAHNVARAAAACGAAMVLISTDYVFDGSSRRPYQPNDPPRPLSVYGQSKLAGERAVAEVGGSWTVVRTSWLYGRAAGFVPAILRRAARGEALRVVNDQRGRPTWAQDASGAVLDLVERGARGLWHVAGGGDCTWFELAREAVRLARYDVPVEAVSTSDYGAPAGRPAYAVLDIEATERLLDRPMRDWRDALRCYLRQEWAGQGASTATA